MPRLRLIRSLFTRLRALRRAKPVILVAAAGFALFAGGLTAYAMQPSEAPKTVASAPKEEKPKSAKQSTSQTQEVQGAQTDQIHPSDNTSSSASTSGSKPSGQSSTAKPSLPSNHPSLRSRTGSLVFSTNHVKFDGFVEGLTVTVSAPDGALLNWPKVVSSDIRISPTSISNETYNNMSGKTWKISILRPLDGPGTATVNVTAGGKADYYKDYSGSFQVSWTPKPGILLTTVSDTVMVNAESAKRIFRFKISQRNSAAIGTPTVKIEFESGIFGVCMQGSVLSLTVTYTGPAEYELSCLMTRSGYDSVITRSSHRDDEIIARATTAGITGSMLWFNLRSATVVYN